jgi:C4-dicarboxylate transporter, DctM subunit
MWRQVITEMGTGELTIAVLPWLLTMLGFLLPVTFVPEISLQLRQLGLL